MIKYRGIEYPTRELDMGEPEGIVTFAPTALQDQFLDMEEVRDDAVHLDEQIFFYLNKKEWDMDDQTLITYLKPTL